MYCIFVLNKLKQCIMNLAEQTFFIVLGFFVVLTIIASVVNNN